MNNVNVRVVLVWYELSAVARLNREGREECDAERVCVRLEGIWPE